MLYIYNQQLDHSAPKLIFILLVVPGAPGVVVPGTPGVVVPGTPGVVVPGAPGVVVSEWRDV